MSASKLPGLFPTMVVGSLPRPQWVRDLIEDRKTGITSEESADRLLDDAIPMAIRMQEQAGLDFVSDGEWRRESYVKVFAEAVDGFKSDLLSAASAQFATLSYPAVVGKLQPRRPIAGREAEFLVAHTKARPFIAVPSPYTVARRMWSPEHSKGAYPTREGFMEACIPIIRDELKRLVKAGVAAIQLDDPWLALLVDPEYRKREGITNVDHEIDMSVKGVNGAVVGINGPLLSVHMCHAHFARKHGSKGPYHLIMGALGKMNVDRFAIEMATPDAGGLDSLEAFPRDKVLGLGVIDHTNPHIETPEEVAARVEAAMKYVPKERLTLNPDCGFSPSSVNPMDFDEAYKKLKAMCAGAALLRRKYS